MPATLEPHREPPTSSEELRKSELHDDDGVKQQPTRVEKEQGGRGLDRAGETGHESVVVDRPDTVTYDDQTDNESTLGKIRRK
jgi:hypothetical protein